MSPSSRASITLIKSPFLRSPRTGISTSSSLRSSLTQVTASRFAASRIHARTMTTFHIQEYDNLPVKLPEGLTEKQVLDFKPFNTWVSTLISSLRLQSTDSSHPFSSSPYSLTSITVQSYDIFGFSRVGFLKASAKITNAQGEHLPGSVFLRGPTVAMLVILTPDDVPRDNPDGERYAVLTVQPRVPAGSLAFVELPAGMVDDAGSFAGAAAKEMHEELGLTIKEDELTCLSELAGQDAAELETAGNSRGREGSDEGLPRAMYPSAGGCDEHVTIYSYEKRVSRAQLDEWSGRLTGLRNEGEKITLKIVPMKDLWKVGGRDAKCLGAVALWEGLRRENKL